jgi:formylmethanofuran dehydrogenase subunit C
MALRLELMNRTPIPVEVEGVHPTAVLGKSLGEIERLNVFHGNRPVALADFFRVSGTPDDACMRWEGELSGVHWIGAGMSQGSIWIDGSAGRHVGSRMRGGRLEVSGDVSDWLGGEMLNRRADFQVRLFRRACQGRFEFLRLEDRTLERHQ